MRIALLASAALLLSTGVRAETMTAREALDQVRDARAAVRDQIPSAGSRSRVLASAGESTSSYRSGYGGTVVVSTGGTTVVVAGGTGGSTCGGSPGRTTWSCPAEPTVIVLSGGGCDRPVTHCGDGRRPVGPETAWSRPLDCGTRSRYPVVRWRSTVSEN